MEVDLLRRKELLSQIIEPTSVLRFSDHFDSGMALFAAARDRGLEGIVAKRRNSRYAQKRSRDWLKIKLVQNVDCVIGGFTDPKGSREHFGSIALGLYDSQGRLIPVGQAGSGFTEESHAAMWELLKPLQMKAGAFFGDVESTRGVHFVQPKLVAEIRFTEWTHEGQSGSPKMRAPVFQGLREDKRPEECVLEEVISS